MSFGWLRPKPTKGHSGRVCEFFMVSMYGAFIVNYKQDLPLENLHSSIYFYLIFLPECFITMAKRHCTESLP